MRRTAVYLGLMSESISDLAEVWGLRPGAGPGKGHSVPARLALRVVAQCPPVLDWPEEIRRPTAGGDDAELSRRSR